MSAAPFGLRVVETPWLPPDRMVLVGDKVYVALLPCFECDGRGWLRPEGWPFAVSTLCSTCRGRGRTT